MDLCVIFWINFGIGVRIVKPSPNRANVDKDERKLASFLLQTVFNRSKKFDRFVESFKTITCRGFEASIIKQHAVIVGFFREDDMENVLLYNHLFLLFKLYVFCCWERGFLDFTNLVNQTTKVKKIVKESSFFLNKSLLSVIENGEKLSKISCLAFLSNARK